MRNIQRNTVRLAATVMLSILCAAAQAAVVHLNAGQTLIQTYDFSADAVQPPYKFGNSIYVFPNADGFDNGDAWSMTIFDSANQVLGGAGVASSFLGGLVGSQGFGQGFTLPQPTNETQITARLVMQSGSMDVDFRLALKPEGGGNTTTLPSSAMVVPLPAALPLFGSVLLLCRTRKRQRVDQGDPLYARPHSAC